MTLNELDAYFRSFLKIENFSNDLAINGIQIENSDPSGKIIKKIAFAVDACEETVEKAALAGADMLFVHHGLFWGHCQAITGSHYKRIAGFIKNDIALFACHIPLDANEPYGNNYGLAERLGLKNREPFGTWRGMVLGIKGELEKEVSVEELARMFLGNEQKPLVVLPFGKKMVRTVGVISGGAAEDVELAVAEGLDAYITGEAGHEIYHFVKESGINFIAGGHYQTETIGVNLIKKKVENELGLETVFIDVPTGL
ncbi:MAG: Nif3-like dinuclear metal center hexameric protein [Treponema sp.]|nr:Nif3-like dinuclear metal center hexameric protein [Treponema sp.]